jgi:hypothetical protein
MDGLWNDVWYSTWYQHFLVRVLSFESITKMKNNGLSYCFQNVGGWGCTNLYLSPQPVK